MSARCEPRSFQIRISVYTRKMPYRVRQTNSKRYIAMISIRIWKTNCDHSSEGSNVMMKFERGSVREKIPCLNHTIHLGFVDTIYKKKQAAATSSSSSSEDTDDSNDKIMRTKTRLMKKKTAMPPTKRTAHYNQWWN